jgi:glutamate synthase (NADPH/NADH) large chain
MVDLESLDAGDQADLHRLVTLHQTETGSTVARRLLAEWDASLESFVKVMPTDYRRVLDARRRATEAGTDPIQAIMEASHG